MRVIRLVRFPRCRLRCRVTFACTLAALVLLAYAAFLSAKNTEGTPRTARRPLILEPEDSSMEDEDSAAGKQGNKNRRNRAPAFGEIIKGTSHVILNNAVPGCGSDEFVSLVGSAIRETSSLTVIVYPDEITDMTNEPEQKLSHIVSDIYSPALFSGHFYFTPVLMINTNPLMFSIIRDPFEMAYAAYGLVDRRSGDVSFDQCVLQNRSDCFERNQLVKWFCGYDEICSEPSKKSMDRAMSNVNEFFVFVGLMEEYKETVQLAEKLLPDLFRRVTKFPSHVANVENDVRRKKSTSPPEVRQRVRSELKYDYHFYYYVQRRFRQLKATHKIAKSDHG
ncbi:uronyl 2-sulfotransferase-like [Diadema antillarum]|uniref:uronyl 2-sulfotransferase-like n=2 Tax=Diadema antillarum TaxID=105358 RepID=UPI003A87B79A